MALRLSSTGKLLLTAGGRLKTCSCCGDPTRLYRRVFDCCATCRFVWVPSAYLDSLGGEWAGTLLIGGKCYGNPDTIALTREEVETDFPGTLIFEESAITSSSTLDCAAARAASVCPACQECCLTGYVSRQCFQGFQNPDRPSVCCNWGRQWTFAWTQTRLFQVQTFQGYGGNGTCDCFVVAPLPIQIDECTTSQACRVRRDGEGAACETNCTATLLYAFCSGNDCVPGCNTWTECAGCAGTLPGSISPIIPSEVSCGDAGSFGGCNVFQQTRVPCPFICPVGEGLGQDCDEKIIDTAYTCARNCFGGIREIRSEEREFHCQFCRESQCDVCGGVGRCPCTQELQCKLFKSTTSVEISEWTVTVDDSTGCEVDPCTEYNEGSDCPPAFTPPEDVCGEEGGCSDGSGGGGGGGGGALRMGTEPGDVVERPEADSAWSMI